MEDREASDLGGRRLTKKSVSFVDEEKAKPKQPTRLDIMKAELEKMRRRDEELERREKEHRKMVHVNLSVFIKWRNCHSFRGYCRCSYFILFSMQLFIIRKQTQ